MQLDESKSVGTHNITTYKVHNTINFSCGAHSVHHNYNMNVCVCVREREKERERERERL